MLVVPLAELLDRVDDVLEATVLAHFFRRKVGVASGSVPVSRDGLCNSSEVIGISTGRLEQRCTPPINHSVTECQNIVW